MATEDEFHAAAEDVKALPSDPGNDTKLQLYALYKQATEGDVQGKRPGFTNPVGRAKYDAWAAVQGTGPRRRSRPVRRARAQPGRLTGQAVNEVARSPGASTPG